MSCAPRWSLLLVVSVPSTVKPINNAQIDAADLLADLADLRTRSEQLKLHKNLSLFCDTLFVGKEL